MIPSGTAYQLFIHGIPPSYSMTNSRVYRRYGEPGAPSILDNNQIERHTPSNLAIELVMEQEAWPMRNQDQVPSFQSTGTNTNNILRTLPFGYNGITNGITNTNPTNIFQLAYNRLVQWDAVKKIENFWIKYNPKNNPKFKKRNTVFVER